MGGRPQSTFRQLLKGFGSLPLLLRFLTVGSVLVALGLAFADLEWPVLSRFFSGHNMFGGIIAAVVLLIPTAVAVVLVVEGLIGESDRRRWQEVNQVAYQDFARHFLMSSRVLEQAAGSMVKGKIAYAERANSGLKASDLAWAQHFFDQLGKRGKDLPKLRPRDEVVRARSEDELAGEQAQDSRALRDRQAELMRQRVALLFGNAKWDDLANRALQVIKEDLTATTSRWGSLMVLDESNYVFLREVPEDLDRIKQVSSSLFPNRGVGRVEMTDQDFAEAWTDFWRHCLDRREDARRRSEAGRGTRAVETLPAASTEN